MLPEEKRAGICLEPPSCSYLQICWWQFTLDFDFSVFAASCSEGILSMQRQVLPSTTWGQTPWTSCHLRWTKRWRAGWCYVTFRTHPKSWKGCRKLAVPYGFASMVKVCWPGWNSSQPTLWCTKRGQICSDGLVLATRCFQTKWKCEMWPPKKEMNGLLLVGDCHGDGEGWF